MNSRGRGHRRNSRSIAAGLDVITDGEQQGRISTSLLWAVEGIELDALHGGSVPAHDSTSKTQGVRATFAGMDSGSSRRFGARAPGRP